MDIFDVFMMLIYIGVICGIFAMGDKLMELAENHIPALRRFLEEKEGL